MSPLFLQSIFATKCKFFRNTGKAKPFSFFFKEIYIKGEQNKIYMMSRRRTRRFECQCYLNFLKPFPNENIFPLISQENTLVVPPLKSS